MQQQKEYGFKYVHWFFTILAIIVFAFFLSLLAVSPVLIKMLVGS